MTIQLKYIVLLLLLVGATMFTLTIQAPYLLATATMYGPLLIFLVYRNPTFIKPNALFAIVFCLWLILIDYVSLQNNAWTILTGIIPPLWGIEVEDIIWGWCATLLVSFLFVEFANFKHPPTTLWTSQLKRLMILFSSGLLILVLVTHTIGSEILRVRYGYAIFVFLTVAIPLFILGRKSNILRHHLPSVIMMASFCLIFGLVDESVNIYLGNWVFNGDYVSTLSLPLGAKLPLEELIGVLLLGPIFCLMFYEYAYKDIIKKNEK